MKNGIYKGTYKSCPTNNIVEQLFRWLNYEFRRIHGNHSIRRNLDNVPELLLLEENLKNSNYMKLIFGEEINMAKKFAEIDVKIIREMEKNHHPKKKMYYSRKIKKTLQSPDFKKQLLAAFQSVAS